MPVQPVRTHLTTSFADATRGWWVNVDVISRPSNTPRIRVLIADDHTAARRQLRNTIEAAGDFEVVGEADDAALALQLARGLRPDMVLVDEDMPILCGAEIARVLANELPTVDVLVLTPADREVRLGQNWRACSSSKTTTTFGA